MPGAMVYGPKSPTAAVDNATVGTVAWSDPGNVYTEDGNVATVSLAASAISHYIAATAFGFSIPAGVAILGVIVEVKCTGNTNAIKFKDVYLIVGGVIGGTDESVDSYWPSSLAYVSNGGASNLWGCSLTPANVNANDFGVAVAARNASGLTSGAIVDHIRVTVYTTGKAYSKMVIIG